MSQSNEIAPLSTWANNHTRPLVIAGPCSVESEEQMLQTAKQIAGLGQVSLLRGGIWKPRTRPNSFEGIGREGLQWLKSAGEATGLPVTTEVANGRHVEWCLEAGIDILWIGARTTVNPFYIQEIADAVQGADVAVMIKNPVNPDLSLWLGGIERMAKAGITKLAAIHRGFSHFGASNFRNDPMWHLPIELRIKLPEIPIICDPSHIAGERQYLRQIAQKALDLNMDGLMIETHYRPEEALSDAAQQITPDQLSDLIGSMVVRQLLPTEAAAINQLEMLREGIDNLDEQLVRLLHERFQVISKIGEYKRENEITILQPDRWTEILERVMTQANGLEMNPEFVKNFMQAIHTESIRLQTEIMNTKTRRELPNEEKMGN